MTETAPGCVASVNGALVSSAEAIDVAAALLADSRSPVVTGLGTDIAGAKAALALAQAIGASIDHMDADPVFANLEVMRRAGWIVTTPLQTRARADTVLLVGGGLPEAWPEMTARLGLATGPTLVGGSRRVFRLCSDTSDGVTILSTLAALRAIVAGRGTSLDQDAARPLRDLAAALAEARFGVAIWSAASIGTLAVELLCGLIDDLNRTTRFAGLPVMSANGADGVMQAAAWATGFPVRTSFAGAKPLHDPWQFDAQRLIATGEADAAIWISALSPTLPPWGNAVPTIALVPPGTVSRPQPGVVFEVGCPGRDHDAMLFDQALGGIAFAAASAPRTIPNVADTVTAITAALSC